MNLSRVVSPAVLDILDAMRVEGTVAYLPDGQLDRALYQDVNKVLDALGGRWDRRQRGHVFDHDPSDELEHVMRTGQVVRERDALGWFPTPPGLADQVIERAAIEPMMWVLEPSAGMGALADRAKAITGRDDVAEIDARRLDHLRGNGYLHNVIGTDFLTCRPTPDYQRVVMNPPFARQQDITHVLHALRFLRPGGRLVAIMSPGWTFRETVAAREFRELVSRQGQWEALPEGSFRESGTDVRAGIVELEAA